MTLACFRTRSNAAGLALSYVRSKELYVSSHFFGFDATTHFPTPKKRRSRRATKADRENEQKEEKKQQGPKRTGTFKYGLEVPKNWKDLLRIDEAAGNRKWQEAVEKEVAALVMHGCFDFKSPDFKPSGEYQYCRLHFVYEVKNDLRQKARLVCDGSRVDPRGLSTRATVVKGVSVRLLDLIADAQDLEVICGDIGNAFIQAETNEKNIPVLATNLAIVLVALLLSLKHYMV